MRKILITIVLSVVCFTTLTAMARNTNTPTLEQYRTKITNIDQEIIRLVAERNEIVKKVGKYKKKHDLPVYAPNREAQLKKTHTAIAIQYDVSPELINNIFDLIISNSKNLEKKV